MKNFPLYFVIKNKFVSLGDKTDFKEWEKASGMNKRTFARYLNLCYFSPKIVADILEYNNPCNITLRELMNLAERASDFERQEKGWKKT